MLDREECERYEKGIVVADVANREKSFARELREKPRIGKVRMFGSYVRVHSRENASSRRR
jgi:predicted nucleotidyltransferase